MRASNPNTISKIEFTSEIEILRGGVTLLKKHASVKGSIASFPDLLQGVNSLEDVYAWEGTNFGTASECRGGGEDPNSSIWDDFNGTANDSPTFGPF